jgi:protein involved in polysaccharide export with SLBB domain
MRSVQLKRNNKVLAVFDVYEFLAKGEVQSDVKLLDGDVIVYPALYAQVALLGSVNTPSVVEIKSAQESITDLLRLGGGLSLMADPGQVYVERMSSDSGSKRALLPMRLNSNSPDSALKNGDVIHFYPKRPELSAGVTLRGAVTQARKVAWKQGMKINDLIPSKADLVSKDSYRRQNEALFDFNERERTLRKREQIPEDLLLENTKTTTPSSEMQGRSPNTFGQGATKEPQASTPTKMDGAEGTQSLAAWQMQRDRRLLSQQPKIDETKSKSLIEQVGQLLEAINLDYAVLERIDPKDLSVKVIPFNLGLAITDPNSPDNLALESGDVVTVFSADDLQVPISKRQVMVRIEGEVNRPGAYQMRSNETLIDLLERAGGMTREAYVFGAGLYREEIKKTQTENLDKLLRRLESESAASLAQLSQSMGASTDANIMQARLIAGQQAQKQAIERFKTLKPDGRIALGLEPSEIGVVSKLPNLRLRNNDVFKVPSRPDFVYIYGAVNTEAALIYKQDWTAQDYLSLAGTASSADKDALILIRADGTAVTNNRSWSNRILSSKIYPCDSIVVPEKIDRESAWSSIFRNTKDMTQIFYNLGLGAAAIRTLRN